MQRFYLFTSVILGYLLSVMVCYGASIPVPVLPAISEILQRDFVSIDEIRTVSMSDDQNGSIDLVVVGAGHQGWRVAILRVENQQVTKRWDSGISVKGVEFQRSGLQSIELEPKDDDYDLIIQGCAPHLCTNGISGFLIFSGKTGTMYTAKVVTRGLDQSPSELPKYDVTFSAGISDQTQEALREVICRSPQIGNKQGLPFACKKP